MEAFPLPTLPTPRLLLRPLVADDAHALHRCYGDVETMRYWDHPPALDLTETQARITQSLQTDPAWHAAWAVVLRENGELIGLVNYHHRDPAAQRLEIGYLLARPYWHLGYMSEAVEALLRHCFEELGAHRVEAMMAVENAGSVHLAQRLGFRLEGLLRDRQRVAGQFRSVLMFALIEDEWRARRK
jgi:ribosomal-protein-alanine N-acetyltransferase